MCRGCGERGSAKQGAVALGGIEEVAKGREQRHDEQEIDQLSHRMRRDPLKLCGFLASIRIIGARPSKVESWLPSVIIVSHARCTSPHSSHYASAAGSTFGRLRQGAAQYHWIPRAGSSILGPASDASYKTLAHPTANYAGG
jgi:hypothetical protein